MKTIIRMAIFTLALFSTTLFANSNTIRLLLREVQYSNESLVRVSAVDTLRDFASNSEVKNMLLRIIENIGEDRAVRMASVKALSSMTDNDNISNIIVRAHDQSSDAEFRSTCLQSLYKSAKTNARVQRGLINNLLSAPSVEIRRASAFGLMASTNDRNVRDALGNVAINPRNDVRQRIEAIKSLYSRSTDGRIKKSMQGLAQNNLENLSVRVAAIRFMVTYPQETRARSILERILETGGNSSVRGMAARSIRFNLRENDIRWFHLTTDPRGNFSRDPFEGSDPFNFTKVNKSLVNGGGINFN